MSASSAAIYMSYIQSPSCVSNTPARPRFAYHWMSQTCISCLPYQEAFFFLPCITLQHIPELVFSHTSTSTRLSRHSMTTIHKHSRRHNMRFLSSFTSPATNCHHHFTPVIHIKMPWSTSNWREITIKAPTAGSDASAVASASPVAGEGS